jgi:hypothetical protein
MILVGTVEIYGMNLSARMEINDKRIIIRPRAYKLPSGKWRAYKTVDGVQKAFGTHDTKEQALIAARLERKPASRKSGGALGVYRKASKTENGMWRVVLTIERRTVRLGEYATYGHAILVRDVVARRCGMRAHVMEYEMPLWLVSNPVARSYILDRVHEPTPSQVNEYLQRVNELNHSGAPVTLDAERMVI